VLRNARTLRRLAFAELHIRAEPAVAERHLLTRLRIDAQFARLGGFSVGIALADLAREAALRIVGASHERAEAPELEAQLARPAGRAGTRARAIRVRREHVVPEDVVHRVDDVTDLEVLGAADGRREIAPEVAQQRLPVELAV